jgi:hypothetical protein
MQISADDFNLMGENKHTIKKNTESVLVSNQEFRLEEISEKTKYLVMSSEQDTRRDHNVNTGNTCVEILEYFKYMGRI